ncbi:hypothetical protein A0H81_09633 [Grifola frondosa]|uniref:Uncharacterized protein n=1 Tax=Grifola frondosa TaxID=5627 RepID=A0A1C7LZX4_GRIFR|nr:hypothetical protein A0H81_09633 [Grifola frondosa]
MSNVAPSSLSIDIQRALQQAVGDANNAANLSKKEKKKKDKRAREETPQDPAVKKRSKKHHSADVAVAVAAQPVLPQSVAELAGLHPPLPLPAEVVANEQVAKPRKKKGKGKERAHEDAAPAEVPSPMDIATSSADFLSAVVAAASATSDHPLQPGHPQYDQPMPFLGYPQDFVPYPYPPSPHDAPFGHPQHSPMYPDPSALLPDLSFASSEELLRTLQDFDLSKVVTVLKTLGEAAAAANVSLNAPPLFMPPPLLKDPLPFSNIL